MVQCDRDPTEAELESLYGEQYFRQEKYDAADSLEREHGRRLRLLRKAGLANGATLLDAGCGPGDFLESCAEEYMVWGTDISNSAVQQAKQRLPKASERILAGKLGEVDLPGGFDAIALWDVLEHLPNPREITAKLTDLLRPGGILALSTPNIGALTGRLLGKRWPFMTPPEHVCFYDRKILRRLFAENGFEILIHKSLGKWTTVGFVVYKLGRVFDSSALQKLRKIVSAGAVGRIPLYIPTGDIQYLVARKTGSTG